METQEALETLQPVDITDQLPAIISSTSELLAPFLLASIGISVLFVLVAIISAFRKRKVERAIIDIQKTLHEMNERDKARAQPIPRPSRPSHRSDTIAATPPTLTDREKVSLDN